MPLRGAGRIRLSPTVVDPVPRGGYDVKRGENVFESLDAVFEGLSLSPKILRELVEAIPGPELTAVRRPGFWSIQDHVIHLADVQPMLYARLVRFRDEEHPEFIPYLPDPDVPPSPGPETADAAVALNEFAARREKMLARIKVYPQAVWQKIGDHPEYTLYTAFGLLRHILMHDHWHMYRIEELWLTRDQFLTELH